jgi:2'-5' RNA ligase
MRIFVGIEITNNDITNSIKEFQEKVNIDGKPVELQNLHFTLQFLGEISEEIAEKIIQSLKTIEFSSFDVNLEGIGAFPKPKFPRVIWVGTDEIGGNMLIRLSKKVEKVLEPLGFFSDKPFKPHITVFRIKKKIGDISGELENHKMVNFGVQKVSNIKLKKSVLTANGPIYSDLVEVNAKK